MALRVALLATLTALLAAATASAATTVGSTLPAWTGATLECDDPGGCTFVPRTISGRSIAVPFDGVIVSWSARMPTSVDTTAVSVEPLRLTAIGATPDGASTTLVPAATAGAIVTRPTRMGVSKGDLIAVDLDNGDEVGLTFHPLLDSLSWSFVPLLTGDRAPDSVDSDDFEAAFNATIEPDADHDVYGDETQDMCPQLSSEHVPCMGKPQVSVSVGGLGIGVVGVGKRVAIHATAGAGDVLVAGARLELTLPAALKPGALSGSAFCTTAGQRVTCPLGNLAPRQGYSVTIDALAVRPAVDEIQASGTTLFGGTPVTAKAALRVTTPKRCGLTIRATDSSERGTTGGDRMFGTTSDDQLVARAGDDCLSGGRGDDLLAGGDGDDRLVGGPGRDRLLGGPGADVISARDGKRDVVRCGPGRDRARVDPVDSVAGCELVTGRR
jgi:RTX calcium-binding nonapeptide repeat (4 copies)